jgi:hypothetical protein
LCQNAGGGTCFSFSCPSPLAAHNKGVRRSRGRESSKGRGRARVGATRKTIGRTQENQAQYNAEVRPLRLPQERLPCLESSDPRAARS